MARSSHDLMTLAHHAPPGAPDSDSWLGGAGGNGDWNTPADWSGGSVPGASATVTFATGDTGYTVTGDATVGAIIVDGDGVTFDGAITDGGGAQTAFLTGLDGASVTLDGNAFVTGGGIDFAAGSLLEDQGILVTTGGTADVLLVDGLSAQYIASGQTQLNQLYVQQGASFTGDVALNDGGSISLDTSAVFGGSITLLGSGLIYDAAAAAGSGGVGSVGDITFGTSNALLTLGSDPGVTLQVGTISGAGSLLVNSGTVEITGGSDYAGITSVQDAALIIDDLAPPQAQLIFVTDGALTYASLNGAAGATLVDTVVAAGSSDTITAGGARLLAFASSLSLTFIGGDGGSSTVVGNGGLLNVIGGGSNDVIYGAAGALTFTGGTGSDTVLGGSGVLVATGGSGSDLIFGGTSGHDTLSTGAGNTRIASATAATFYVTGSGTDVLASGGGGLINANAATGNDTLFVGANTTVLGGGGVESDILQGAATVYAGPGTTDIFGGGSAAQLYLTDGFGGGTIKVAGLTLSELQIGLVGYSASEASQALASATVAGGNTYLVLSDNTHVDLFGITGLTSTNFA